MCKYVSAVAAMTDVSNVATFVKKVKQSEDSHWGMLVDAVGAMVVVPAGHFIVCCGVPEAEGAALKAARMCLRVMCLLSPQESHRRTTTMALKG